ncbi:MAG TPA: hypothetical protein VGH03_06185 [Caulobacteraceae bacterium]|jgi:hypothetical protein
MSSPQDPADQPASGRRPKRPAAAEPESAAAESVSAEALVVVTLKAKDGAILKIESVEADGSRHELSAGEAGRLLGDHPKKTVQSLVHEAFEAGIACVLDDGPIGAGAEEASGESKEDAALHDELLGALIERSPAKRLLQGDILNSVVLGALISVAPRTESRPAA